MLISRFNITLFLLEMCLGHKGCHIKNKKYISWCSNRHVVYLRPTSQVLPHPPFVLRFTDKSCGGVFSLTSSPVFNWNSVTSIYWKQFILRLHDMGAVSDSFSSLFNYSKRCSHHFRHCLYSGFIFKLNVSKQVPNLKWTIVSITDTITSLRQTPWAAIDPEGLTWTSEDGL